MIISSHIYSTHYICQQPTPFTPYWFRIFNVSKTNINLRYRRLKFLEHHTTCLPCVPTTYCVLCSLMYFLLMYKREHVLTFCMKRSFLRIKYWFQVGTRILQYFNRIDRLSNFEQVVTLNTIKLETH